MLADPFGRRGALTLIVLPSTLIGGALIAYGARYIRGDISRCVEELLEEKEEADRVRQGDGATPAVQVRNLDFSYGSVQVLFDVNLDVAHGETVALLGTNGAGKSTLLRVISGLGVASRGVVRLHGRTITYADPELRAKVGVVQLMGGNAVFSVAVGGGEPPHGGVPLRRRRAPHARVEAALRALPRAGRAPAVAVPATSPAVSSRCSRWPWRCCTSPTC